LKPPSSPEAIIYIIYQGIKIFKLNLSIFAYFSIFCPWIEIFPYILYNNGMIKKEFTTRTRKKPGELSPEDFEVTASQDYADLAILNRRNQ